VNLEGLNVSWAGALEASDKLSPLLASQPAPAYLVIFQRDVDWTWRTRWRCAPA